MSNSTENSRESCDASEDGGAAVDGLVRRAQAGDMAAFEDLVRQFQTPMFNLAYRVVNNYEDAADLTQEIFVKLHRSIRRFEGRSKFSTWLYALGMNACRSGLRRLRRVSAMEVVRLDDDGGGDRPSSREAADPGELPGKDLERVELRDQIEAAVAALPEEFRVAVVLRDLQGLSYEEMAEVLRCSVGTVKSRLSRGRLRVKERLVREGVACAVKT